MKLNLVALVYAHHLTPTGYLPREKQVEMSAAWHFAKLAIRALERVPEQVTYEGDKDRTVNLLALADSVRILYGLDSLQDFLPHMGLVKAEAARCQLPWNDRLQAWLDSGGRAFNEVTREPDRLNKQ